MPTYQYVAADGATDEVFELRQGISEPPFESHPDTGRPIQRVITGGLGPLVGKRVGPPPEPESDGGCNGPSCACC